MKKILATAILLIVAFFAFYKLVYNKPHKNVADETAIEISAAQLFVEYTANEKIANEKYLNKAIQVNGKILSVDKNQENQTFIVLKTDDDFNGVMCTMREPNIQLKSGENVNIIGYCSGFVGDVKLTDCILSSK